MNARGFLRRCHAGVAIAPPPDLVPDAFSFGAATGVPLGTVVTSETIAITGLTGAAPISITGGEYKIEDGDWTSAPGTISNDQAVTVRHTSSGSLSTNTVTTLTIGGVAGTFTSTTVASDTTPDPFSFTAVTNATPSTAYQSDPVQLSGMNDNAPFTAIGGALIANGTNLGTSGTCPANALIKAALTSSASYSTLASCIITIGGIEAEFDVTTGADPSPTPTPTPGSSVTPPQAGPAFITVDFTGKTTQKGRSDAILQAMKDAYDDMAGRTDQPRKIAIPPGDCGSIFFVDRVYPSLLSVVPVDYANPPTFQRFANSYSGTGPVLTNVVFDGLFINYPTVTAFGPMMVWNQCKDITVSNFKITTYDPATSGSASTTTISMPGGTYTEVARTSYAFVAGTGGSFVSWYTVTGLPSNSTIKLAGYVEYSVDGGLTWQDTRTRTGNFVTGNSDPNDVKNASPWIAAGNAACPATSVTTNPTGTIIVRLMVQSTGTGTLTGVSGKLSAGCVSAITGLPIQIQNCENFTLYRTEVVGGSTMQIYLTQRAQNAPGNPSLNPRIIQCSFRASNEDGIRPWGAQNFLVEDTYVGDGTKNLFYHGQHADCLQIAQLQGANAFASSGTISGSLFHEKTIGENGERSGIMMTDNVTPYSNISILNNTVLGGGLNCITARGVTSGLTLSGSRCYTLAYLAGANQARINFVSCNGVTAQDNKAGFETVTSSDFLIHDPTDTSSTQTLNSDAARQAIVDAWKAAHPNVPFTLPCPAVA